MKSINVFMVDDNEDFREAWKEHFAEHEHVRLATFDSLPKATLSAYRPDVLFVDITAVSGLLDAENAWRPIAKFAETFPDCHIVVCSCMCKSTCRYVADDIEAATGRPVRVVSIDGTNMIGLDDADPIIAELLGN